MTQKIQTKLINLTNANKRLKEAVTAYKNNPDNSLYRDALIQRFEFTFELAWKTTAEILRDHGVVLEIVSPRTVLQSAFSVGYVTDEETWLQILEARNLMSHIYDEETAIEIADDICKNYAKAISALLSRLAL